MKNIKYIIGLFLTLLFLVSCEEENYEFGSLTAPSDISVSYEIVGKNTANPYGDGTGVVKFTATAKNVLTYKYVVDANENITSTGKATLNFTKTGIHKYIVTVLAYGPGGVSSSKSIEIEVFSAFEDLEAEKFLTGGEVGSSKKWYWAADTNAHAGMGPWEDDYGNKDYSWPNWWSIGKWDIEKDCMYAAEFKFTNTAQGITFEQTVGPAWDHISGTCKGSDYFSTMAGVKKVTFAPSSTKAALQGDWNGAYRGTEITLSDGGFMGWYAGGTSQYDIVEITDKILRVRIREKGQPFVWYHIFKSERPLKP